MSSERQQPLASIFIHSLFRSGSTYIFNVFRRSDADYWCYQEPLNEHLLSVATEPDRLLEISKEKQKYLRHPELKRPYFYEFHAIADEIGQLFNKEFSYDQYFTTENGDITIELKAYFTALLNGAQGRPVFQCCRTAGRVAGLKSEYGGTHIFLWRNPWDQWWSYKKDAFFDTRNLLIANAKNLPTFLRVLKKELNLSDFHDIDIFKESAFFSKHRLDATGSYKLFYALWCHAMLEAKPYCQISVNIDQLSISNKYRNEVLEKLEHIGISGLDFSECSVPMASYGDSDGDFFLKIESHVHELLLHDYSNKKINDLKRLSNERKKSLVDSSAPENSAVRDAMRVREYLQQAETELVEEQRLLIDAQAQAEQAKANTEHLNVLLSEKHDAWVASQAVLSHVTRQLSEKHDAWAAAKAKIEELSHELQAVYNSKSWRITWPLRKFFQLFKWLLFLPIRLTLWVVRLPKRTVRWLLIKAMAFALKRPALKIRTIAWLRKYPRLGARLHRLAQARGLATAWQGTPSRPSDRSLESNEDSTLVSELSHLTPSARRIYGELKTAMAQREQESH